MVSILKYLSKFREISSLSSRGGVWKILWKNNPAYNLTDTKYVASCCFQKYNLVKVSPSPTVSCGNAYRE